MATESATRSTSSNKCEENNTVRPSSATVRTMAARMSRRTTASNPDDGSSSSSNSGRCASAINNPARARWPRDSALIFCCGSSSNICLNSSANASSQLGKKAWVYRINCPTPIQSGKSRSSDKYPVRPRTPTGSATGFRPKTATVPFCAASSPSKCLISVVLPAPFSPTSPNTIPRGTLKDTPLSAVFLPKLRLRLLISMTLSGMRVVLLDSPASFPNELDQRFQPKVHLPRLSQQRVDAFGQNPILFSLG